eukprot:TRINITY_DN45709_c0_g1_i1.p1 TRINITY_DN45709_c0_g1~~TRINITY_DN45709_c0_g1_i1.p1  ORF type:complete len:191 (-),score=32.57 TRINITY_DN45709_c0_g1_i1:87-659(-)
MADADFQETLAAASAARWAAVTSVDCHVFVYGQLTFNDVWGALIGRVPLKRAARLRGYKRLGVRGAPFPALAPCDDDEDDEVGPIDDEASSDSGNKGIFGQAVVGLTLGELKLMDRFVDERFGLVEACMYFIDEPNSPEVSCVVYVWRENFAEQLEETDWDLEEFADTQLPSVLHRCADLRTTCGSDGVS